MAKATAAAYEWLYQEFADGVGDTWLCACFVRDVSPDVALRRIDVVPGSPLEGDGFGVAACRAEGGTVLVEHGWGAIVHDRAGLLYSYRCREGGDPDRLEADVTDLGLHIDGDEPGFVDNTTSAALALAERATGVRLSSEAYTRDALVGSTEHLHPYV